MLSCDICVTSECKYLQLLATVCIEEAPNMRQADELRSGMRASHISSMSSRRHALSETLRRRNQADHQITVGGEVVKMSGLHQHSCLSAAVRSRSSSSDVVTGTRNTAYQPPSTSRRRQSFCAASWASSSRQIVAHALHELRLNAVSLLQHCRNRPLHRRVHREIGIGNHLQPSQRFASSVPPVH